ncbi:solute carrier family 26 member 6-like isoform X3 [Pomacea canaliculata]|uniref:solute carrier family 26 member 6-like isoform X3 n=1 Tax=Pomacea canaliculata TaxID=400727 RepID=UPI000D733607|nr:solute carrier family 26 member 6-like isoform X3 [Pomacea canaliculata]
MDPRSSVRRVAVGDSSGHNAANVPLVVRPEARRNSLDVSRFRRSSLSQMDSNGRNVTGSSVTAPRRISLSDLSRIVDGAWPAFRRSSLSDVHPSIKRNSSRSSCRRLFSIPANENSQVHTDDNDEEDHLTVDDMVVVERPIYTQLAFERGFEAFQHPKKSPKTWIRSRIKKFQCSCTCMGSFFMKLFPFVGILQGYSLRSDFPKDVISGLTVGIMNIPQGMAYGQLTTLDPIYGLYVSFFPVLFYFFFGTSRHISIGTFAVISLMVANAVDKGLSARNIVSQSWNQTVEDGGNITYQIVTNAKEVMHVRVQLALAVTFAAGCVQLLLGIFQLGFVTVYLSDPLISGFTTGAACLVFSSQINQIFGVTTGRYNGPLNLIYFYRDFFVKIPTTNSVTLIASVVTITFLIVVKTYINDNPKIKPKLKMPVPVELIVVVLGTVISHFVQLNKQYKVKTVGDVPTGIPPPSVAHVPYITDVISDAIALGIVAFAISVSMAKIQARKHGYEVDSNQELIAYGLCNIASSFFSSFCAAASLSRTLVQEGVGGKTQVAGLVSSALLLVVLLVLGSYFQSLPNCILASIIVVALRGMFRQFAELKRLWNISVIDFAVWLVSFIATVLLDVDLGLLVGVLFALLTVIIRSQRPYVCLLGQVNGTDLYKDLAIYKAATEIKHIKIFRFDAALFFANSEYFKTTLYKMTVDPNSLKKLKKKSERELRLAVSIPSTNHLCCMQAGRSSGMDTNQIQEVSDTQEADCTETDHKDYQIILPAFTDIYFVIIDCRAINYVDSVGVKVLQQVVTELKTYSVNVFLANCKAAVREMFEKTDFYRTSDKQCLFLSVHDAVRYAQRLLLIVSGEERETCADENSVFLEGIQEHELSSAEEHDTLSPVDNSKVSASETNRPLP